MIKKSWIIAIIIIILVIIAAVFIFKGSGDKSSMPSDNQGQETADEGNLPSEESIIEDALISEEDDVEIGDLLG